MDLTEQYQDRDSFIHWFLICALKGVDITDQIRAEPRKVTMQLNGVELNPMHALKRLEGEFDRLVEKSALEKVEDLKRDILEPFEEQVEDMTSALKKLVESKLPSLGT
jgi:hypothetical protein